MAYLYGFNRNFLCNFSEFQKRRAELRRTEWNQQHVFPHYRHQVKDVKGISILFHSSRKCFSTAFTGYFFLFLEGLWLEFDVLILFTDHTHNFEVPGVRFIHIWCDMWTQKWLSWRKFLLTGPWKQKARCVVRGVGTEPVRGGASEQKTRARTFLWILQEGAGSTGRAGWGLAPGPGDRPSLSDTWLGDGQVDWGPGKGGAWVRLVCTWTLCLQASGLLSLGGVMGTNTPQECQSIR